MTFKRLVTSSELASILGVTPETVSRWEIEPVKSEGRNKLYDFVEVAEWRFRKRMGIDPETGERDGLDLDLKREQLRKLKIENDQKCKELLWARDVVPGFIRVIEAMTKELRKATELTKERMPNVPQDVLDIVSGQIEECHTEAIRAVKGLEPTRDHLH